MSVTFCMVLWIIFGDTGSLACMDSGAELYDTGRCVTMKLGAGMRIPVFACMGMAS